MVQHSSFSVAEYFTDLLKKDAEKSPALAAIETLQACLKRSTTQTIHGLKEEMVEAMKTMGTTDYSTVSINSAAELFMRSITLTALDQPDFDECRKVLLQRGDEFIARVRGARHKIAAVALQFIRNGSKILTHSYSRVVVEAFKLAVQRDRQFHVYVTESAPDKSGYKMQKRLQELNVPCTVILDSAVGYILEQIDFVVLGAEGVVENGGIVNKIGTYGIAALAHLTNTPTYVMAEHVKFIQEYPLNQRDIPNSFKYSASVLKANKDLSVEHPLVDYTPPCYIRLIFTDLGILTPAAVSEEIVKVYL